MQLKKLTLKALIERSIQLYPNNESLSWIDQSPMLFSEFYDQVIIIQNALSKQGIIKGDKVALLSENQPNWGIVYFAVTSMGAVIVPMLPDFKEHEVHHILRHSESKAIFVSEKYYNKVDEFSEDSLKYRYLLDNLTVIPTETTIGKLKNAISKKTSPFVKLTQYALDITGIKKASVEEDDIACIIYTSGTTGHSKGVVLTHKNLVSDAQIASKVFRILPTDIYLSILPLSHTYECTVGLILAIMNGSTVYYLKKPPTARVLLPAMQQVKPTIMLTVPLIIEKIYKAKIKPALTNSTISRILFSIPPIRKILHSIAGKKLYNSFGGRIRFYGIGGALLSAETEKFLIDAKFPYAIGYGLTETAPLIAGCSPFKTKFRSTGWVPSPGEIRIANPDPETGEGEIQYRGPNVMMGYYKDKEKTKETVSEVT